MDASRLLVTGFTEEFHVGAAPAERQFVNISAMNFAPDGELVVLDRGEFAVSVFDREGREIARWGKKGEGPGEFQDNPEHMAVSGGGVVAIDNDARVDLFTLDGSVVDARGLGDGWIAGLMFDGTGALVVGWRPVVGLRGLTEPTSERAVRFDDGEVLWTSPELPAITSLALWSPHVVQAGIGAGRIVVGMSDRYELVAIEVATGSELAVIGRNVPARGPSKEFIANLRETVIGEVDASMSDFVQGLPIATRFPMIGNVFIGPPVRTVWIERLMGIGDILAPPVGDAMADWTYRLYDLFDGDTYEYVGTVEIPEDLQLMAGDSERIAGVHTNAMGVHSVRVLRVTLDANPRAATGESPTYGGTGRPATRQR